MVAQMLLPQVIVGAQDLPSNGYPPEGAGCVDLAGCRSISPRVEGQGREEILLALAQDRPVARRGGRGLLTLTPALGQLATQPWSYLFGVALPGGGVTLLAALEMPTSAATSLRATADIPRCMKSRASSRCVADLSSHQLLPGRHRREVTSRSGLTPDAVHEVKRVVHGGRDIPVGARTLRQPASARSYRHPTALFYCCASAWWRMRACQRRSKSSAFSVM